MLSVLSIMFFLCSRARAMCCQRARAGIVIDQQGIGSIRSLL